MTSAPARPRTGFVEAHRRADEVAAAAEAARSAHRRAIRLFDHRRPHGGQIAPPLYAAEARLRQAAPLLRTRRERALLTVTFWVLLSAVLALPWPWSRLPLGAMLAVTAGTFAVFCAAVAWWYRRARRRLLRHRRPTHHLLPDEVGLDRLGQELALLRDDIALAQALVRPLLPTLPDPDRDADRDPEPGRRAVRAHPAADPLHDAEALLTCAARSIDASARDLGLRLETPDRSTVRPALGPASRGCG
jgi:hypothetical protein